MALRLRPRDRHAMKDRLRLRPLSLLLTQNRARQHSVPRRPRPRLPRHHNRLSNRASARSLLPIARVRGRSCLAHRVLVQSRLALRSLPRVLSHRPHLERRPDFLAHAGMIVRVQAATIVASVVARKASADR